ncbi:MAG: hypothetical protein KatS3mg105_1611 [Gemmatales bacterium]|nr:MAG: hypothetical protein KatS3mg105_1611 [Gemmatales bacterium]
MIKAIVFDFGNVVGFFDYRRGLQKLGPDSECTIDKVTALLSGSELEDRIERGQLASDAFLDHVLNLTGLKCSRERLRDAFVDIFWENGEIAALVPRLKPRYRLLLGSNTCELHALQFKKQFAHVLRHFDHLVLSYEIGFRKPEPAFYHHCLGYAEVAPDECVFIDDLPPNVDGARKCGLHGIVYRGFEDFCRNLAGLGIEF